MAMTEKIKKVVCDAGPIIHLDELDCLNLLSDFREIFLAETVWKEVEKYRPSTLIRSGLSLIRCSQEYPANESLYTMCRIFSLDAGEVEALAIMEKNPTAMFLTDDASARLVAEQVGFRVHGSIGILVRSIRWGQKQPEEVINILGEIPSRSTLYIKPSLIDKIIQEIKKGVRL